MRCCWPAAGRFPLDGEPWGARPDDHLALARPFLQAGLPVLVDKPLADKVSDGVEMVELARRHGAVLMSCSANRYAAEIVSLQQLVADGDLGQLMGATCTLGSGVGTFSWYLVHIFEAIHSIFGPGVDTVYAMSSGDRMALSGGYPAAHAALFRWRDGRLVTVLQLRDETDGTTCKTLREPNILWPTSTIVPPYLPLFYNVQVYGTMGWQQALVKGKGAYRRNLEVFFAAARAGKPPIPYENTLEITQALAAAEESAQTGLPVVLQRASALIGGSE